MLRRYKHNHNLELTTKSVKHRGLRGHRRESSNRSLQDRGDGMNGEGAGGGQGKNFREATHFND